MVESSEIFEKHYLDYCAQLAAVDISAIADTLGGRYYAPNFLTWRWFFKVVG